MGIAGGVLRAYISSTPELKIDDLTSVEETSYIYDINGEVICPYYGLENREWVSLEEIPQTLINAFIASEDESFYEHPGFNIRRLYLYVTIDIIFNSNDIWKIYICRSNSNKRIV